MFIVDTISVRMQAAKYFTFIFFGLSVFVILLFGGFVLCHCYRRLRYDRESDSRPQVLPLAGLKCIVFDGNQDLALHHCMLCSVC